MIKTVEESKNCMKSLEILIQQLEKNEEDIIEGRTIDFLDFKEKLRTKYNI